MISKNQVKYIHQLEQKKYRKREGLFVAEGTKVVGDLLKLTVTDANGKSTTAQKSITEEEDDDEDEE